MTVTAKYLSKWVDKKEQGPRGFPGGPGPVSGGVYPGAGIPLSTGSAWGTSYTTSGTGTVVALQNAPAFTGDVTFDTNTLFIDSSNNRVGILTATPTYPLDVVGAAVFGSDANSKAYIGTTSGIPYIQGSGTNKVLAFYTDAEKMRLNNTGLGIGTTPSNKFHVEDQTKVQALFSGYSHLNTTAHVNSGSIRIGADVDSSGLIDFYSGGNTELVIANTYDNAGSVIDFRLRTAGTDITALSLKGSGNADILGDVMQPSFISGWQGNNWQIQADGDAEFNNVLIRGGLSVFELIINQLHYQNGGLIIGAGAGKIDAISDDTVGTEVMTFHDPEGNDVVPFSEGAIVMVQRVDINRTTVVKKIVRQVDDITGMVVTLGVTTGWTTGDDVGIFEVGDEVVAIGHISDADLDSALYMSAIDSGNPFLRVMDGVSSYAKWSLGDKTTVKLQLGNLASLASYDILPASPGYGLYSDNVYLTGRVVLPSAGITDEGSSASDIRIYAGAAYADRASAPFMVTQDGSLTATGVAMLGTSTASVGGKSQNVAIQGPYIWENAYDGDGSGLYINTKGYAGTTDHYRSLYIGDGKGTGSGHNMMVIIPGATQSITFGDLGYTESTLLLEVFGSEKVYKDLTVYEDFYVGATSQFVGSAEFDDDVTMLADVSISGPHFSVPRKTQTQINAMTPAAGMIVYNTTNGHFYGYTNAWYQLDN